MIEEHAKLARQLEAAGYSVGTCWLSYKTTNRWLAYIRSERDGVKLEVNMKGPNPYIALAECARKAHFVETQGIAAATSTLIEGPKSDDIPF